MYAIIKDEIIIWFTDKKITEKNMIFDYLIEWSFDIRKNYNLVDGKIIENLPILNEKQTIIDEIKELWKQGEELRSKYLSAELLPESELKTETLRVLKEKWDLVMTQYIEKQNILIEKYGIEILQEII